MVRPQKFVFRADASTLIGTGHVMRCLTLAHALKEQHHGKCMFICRDLPGNLAERIRAEGFECAVLPSPNLNKEIEGPPAHAAWAGVTWQQDAQDTQRAIADWSPDWLVVDHYAFDARWEEAVKPRLSKLFVIDDLADRPHICDLLLDQNLGRAASDYDGLVPDACQRLIGPIFALLRPEFFATRAVALAARADRGLKHLLISMGGLDGADATSTVLSALRDALLPDDLRVTVIMGSNSPALERVRALAREMPRPTEVAVDVSDMASRMAAADLAIGAAGATTWERCCLGLPSIIVKMADNQAGIAEATVRAGAVLDAGPLQAPDFARKLQKAVAETNNSERLAALSNRAAHICDGAGVKCVLSSISVEATYED